MKKQFITIFALLITACQVFKSTDDFFEEKLSRPNYFSSQEMNVTDEFLTGKNVFIELRNIDTGNSKQALLEKIKFEFKQWFDNNGFQIVDSQRKANLVVYLEFGIGESRYHNSIMTENVIKQSIQENKWHKQYSLKIEGYKQSYAKRPRLLFHSFLMANKNNQNFDQLTQNEVTKWLDSLRVLSGRVKEEIQNGDAGCFPRFGFEQEIKYLDVLPQAFVKQVHRDSAAEKAGLKVGDEIISIDSKTYANGDFDSSERMFDIYEKQLLVPIVLKRNGSEVKSKIKAKLMCY